jgi:DNA polymerase-1
MKTYLILDCNFLCHRAHHSTGGLSFDGDPTGVIYGFLRDIRTLQDVVLCDHILFCWDFGIGLREKDYPYYKASRRGKAENCTPEEREAVHNFRAQLNKLRKEILPELGYNNVFYQSGYEADDIIYSVCVCSMEKDSEAVIVSADKDLYQLLRPSISMYNPITKKFFTNKDFREKYGLDPEHWSRIKAIAGCSTDEVPGVRGVGELTAAKFLRGQLKSTTASWKAIIAADAQVKENLKLVQLPYKGVNQFEVVEDTTDHSKWRKVSSKYGIKTL